MAENKFLRERLSRYSGDFTFLIGNGINLYFQQALSWNKLLSRMVEKKGLALPRSVLNVLNAKESQPGLTFPEIASLIEKMNNAEGGSATSLKQAIAACFEGKDSCCALLDYAQRTQKDIITTNYDFTIEDSLGIRRSPSPGECRLMVDPRIATFSSASRWRIPPGSGTFTDTAAAPVPSVSLWEIISIH